MSSLNHLNRLADGDDGRLARFPDGRFVPHFIGEEPPPPEQREAVPAIDTDDIPF